MKSGHWTTASCYVNTFFAKDFKFRLANPHQINRYENRIVIAADISHSAHESNPNNPRIYSAVTINSSSSVCGYTGQETRYRRNARKA